MDELAPRYGFPVVSDGGESGKHPVHEPKPPDHPENFESGRPVGTVEIRRKESPDDSEVEFEFQDPRSSTLTAMGQLPTDSSSKGGSARLKIVGGTGQFEGKSGDVVLKWRNPKRWSTDPP